MTRATDTGVMPKRPSPSQPEPPQATSTIYKFTSRLQWVGIIEATDKREAIEKAVLFLSFRCRTRAT
jgi:hypothetical protein